MSTTNCDGFEKLSLIAMLKINLRKGLSIPPLQALIYRIAWSPDCEFLATGDDDNTIKIWDTTPERSKFDSGNFDTAELLAELAGHTGTVLGLDWSPSGKFLASASADRSVRIWDVEKKEQLYKLSGHVDEVTCVTWVSEEGLLSGSNDEHILFWNTEIGMKRSEFPNDHQRVLCMALSPDRVLLATGAPDGIVRIWNWQKRQCIHKLKGHEGEVYSIAWANNKTLASGSEDTTIRMWNLDQADESKLLLGHNDRVLAVSFSHNTQLLVSQSADDTLRFWDTKMLRPIDFYGYECSRHIDTGVGFDHKSPLLVSLGKKDRVFRTWHVPIDEMIQDALMRSEKDNATWNKQEKVMISSTIVDLPVYRHEARHACEAAGYYPLLFEDRNADPRSTLEISYELVDQCDLYVGIFAQRYGSLTEMGKSVTELEYERALNAKKDCYIFMMDEKQLVSSEFVDEGENRQRLMAFKEKLMSKHTVRFFSSPEDLYQKIFAALNERFLKRRGIGKN
jgi:hypothetical protein